MKRYLALIALILMYVACWPAGLLVLHAMQDLAADVPATQPVSTEVLERRANAAFARGDWFEAVPLLKQLAVRLKDDPVRVGPILERIAVAEANLPGGGGAQAQSLSANRRPHPPPTDQVRQMTIIELGNFDYDMDIGGNIPEDVKRLSGSKVRLIGYMIPLDQGRRITRFALVPDLFACCFGQPPGLQHTIVVSLPEGSAVRYWPDELWVEGTLTVEERVDGGFIVSVFELLASSVKPVAQ